MMITKPRDGNFVPLARDARGGERYPLALLAGDAHPALARALAERCAIPLVPATVAAFADGETQVRLDATLADCDVYIVQPLAPPANERLMTLALLADAARSAGAVRITAVVPYLAYARQDVRSTPGEPRSARLIAEILRTAGVDRAVTLELHSPALESAFPIPIVHLSAEPLVLPVLRDWQLGDLTIVAPDAGGLKRAQRYAAALDAGLAVVTKARPQADVAVAHQLLGAVQGRRCLIVDDMTSTGNTVALAAQLLWAAGAREVHVFFVHAVLAAGALERMQAAGVQRMLTTDSLPGPPDSRLQVLSIAPLLAESIARLAGLRCDQPPATSG